MWSRRSICILLFPPRSTGWGIFLPRSDETRPPATRTIRSSRTESSFSNCEPAYIIEPAEWLNNLRGEECHLICFSAVRRLRFLETSKNYVLLHCQSIGHYAIRQLNDWGQVHWLNQKAIHAGCSTHGALIEAKWLLWTFNACVCQIKTSTS